MLEEQKTIGPLTEKRIRERLAVLRKLAHGTIASISNIDERAVYKVLVGRDMPKKIELGTKQAAVDIIQALTSVANREGVVELLEAGGVVSVVRNICDSGFSVTLAGDLAENGEFGKVGPTIVKNNLLEDRIEPSIVHNEKLNADWVQRAWEESKDSGDGAVARELSRFKPKDLLKELAKGK